MRVKLRKQLLNGEECLITTKATVDLRILLNQYKLLHNILTAKWYIISKRNISLDSSISSNSGNIKRTSTFSWGFNSFGNYESI